MCAASCACRHAVAASAEHAEIGGDDFEAGALLAFLILPFARLDAALDEDEGAFFQVLLGDFGLLSPNNNFVPFGAFLPLAVFVFVRFVGGDREIGDSLATGGVTGFGIAAEAADENDFIDGHLERSKSGSLKRTESCVALLLKVVSAKHPDPWKITWAGGKRNLVERLQARRRGEVVCFIEMRGRLDFEVCPERFDARRRKGKATQNAGTLQRQDVGIEEGYFSRSARKGAAVLPSQIPFGMTCFLADYDFSLAI